ncbi:MAG TPA: bifunctional diaminohydroxyphosphoribosylaminopyrimidine deaminase/5-amino-6-(5-phosphoribosylamino)uracil reductase RibD [Gammaproteobacteria bacterium]|nr:bifunctional diaminohydroxyphosphoribosylaminopyrimidine deaminase/5-amino-6-(5-phosphoribosylamino)uracil reductase RibD [Gammaproteobacteria bacterium]
MARAHQLAARGLYTTDPNPRVGCVIARGDELVGEGFHIRAGGPHAEIHALRMAGDKARGATAYVTLEPCSHTGKTPPCADALIRAGVGRVVAAMEDPNPLVAGRGLERLREAGVETAVGLQAEQTRALNPGFIKRMRDGLPWVRVKLAMSLDGRTAMASGESQWITGEAARLDVQRLRARASAVLTGVGTVLDDNPSMNLRVDAAWLGAADEPAQPAHAIVDSRLRTPVDARILQTCDKVMIFHAPGVKRPAYPPLVETIAIEAAGSGIDLKAVLRELARRQVNECHVEAGATLAGGLLQAGLVDEIIVYMAPHLMGDAGRGLFHLPGLEAMRDRVALHIDDIRAVGDDWRIRARRP